MGYQEFDELGEKIQDIIDQAINENNYQKLSQTINQTVNRAIDSGSDALRNVLNGTFGNVSGGNAAGNNDTDRNGMGNAAGNTSRTDGAAGSKNAGGPGGRQYQYHSEYTNYRTGSSSQDYRQNRTWEFQENRNNRSNRNDTKNQSGNNAQANKNHVKEQTSLSADIQRSLYAPSTGIKVKGILMTTFGGILTGTFGTVALTLGLIGGIAGNVGMGVAALILGACTAASGVLLGNGCTSLAGLKRRKKYIQELGTHTYCDFQRLSRAVGKPVKFVKKDIKKMISKGWFLQGHVDAQETCLITSNETYDQYVSTQKQLEERQRLDARRLSEEQEKESRENRHSEEKQRKNGWTKEKSVTEESLTPEVQQVLDKGNDFLYKIRRSNDAIPGEEISRKISRMELIVQKIFERVRKHPEIIPDLNRLLDYYLPMTVKLLNAYEDMDSQPVQGENITSSKKEIEATIDTLNTAFEKLLDSVFEDTAMDVSSDISVLNTVLAQEGLTEDELTRMRKEAKNVK